MKIRGRFLGAAPALLTLWSGHSVGNNAAKREGLRWVLKIKPGCNFAL